MGSSNQQHVVRLSPRSSLKIEATTLPKRMSTIPMVRLSSATRMMHTIASTQCVERAPHKHALPLIPKVTHAAPKSRSQNFMQGMFAKRTHHTMSLSLGLTFASGMIGKFATILLIPMLLLQPLLPVYAADESVAAPESTPAVVDTPSITPTSALESSPASDETPAAEATETLTETPASDTPPPPDETPDPLLEEVHENIDQQESREETPGVVVETDATTTPETAQDEGQTQDNQEDTATTTDTTSPGEISDGTVMGGGGDVTSEILNSEEAASADEATATSADETNSEAEASTENVAVADGAPTDEAALRAAQEESEHQAEEARQTALRESIKKEVESAFTKGCLTLDGVGYYCLKNFDGNTAGALTPSTAVTGVVSHQDADAEAGADKEIFMTKGGESIQLTHNTWDDTFPAMDVSGKSVAWQGMVDGRWQIFIANVSGTGTPAITQLTHGTESNFNPRVDGDTVVWQGWVNGNWEIFLAERLLPAAYYPLRPDTPQDPGGGLPVENRMLGIDNTWQVARLTTNETHDMFPSIAGGLVTWQSSQEGTWNVYAYSIKTGATTRLSQDGTKSENPRFAVTWDEHDANGNARMVGYDIATGKTIDITSEARNTPSGSAPYHPTETPISQPNQAALPPTSSGTSTTMKVDGDDGGDGNTLANGLDV